MRVTIHVLFLLLISTSVNAQDVSEPRHYMNLQGEGWRRLSEPTQLMYLYGVSEGKMMATATISRACESCGQCSVQVMNPANLTIRELKAGLDRFFTNTKNDHVPVIEALDWVEAKAKGATTETLVEMEEALRQAAEQGQQH